MLFYVSVSWLVALFTLTGIPARLSALLHSTQFLGYLLSCALCLGWHVGLGIGIYRVYLGGDLSDLVTVPFFISSISYAFKYAINWLDLTQTERELRISSLLK